MQGSHLKWKCCPRTIFFCLDWHNLWRKIQFNSCSGMGLTFSFSCSERTQVVGMSSQKRVFLLQTWVFCHKEVWLPITNLYLHCAPAGTQGGQQRNSTQKPRARRVFSPLPFRLWTRSKFPGVFISLARNKPSNSSPLHKPFGFSLWEHDIPFKVSTNRSGITTYIETVIRDRCSSEQSPALYVTARNSGQRSAGSFY